MKCDFASRNDAHASGAAWRGFAAECVQRHDTPYVNATAGTRCGRGSAMGLYCYLLWSKRFPTIPAVMFTFWISTEPPATRQPSTSRIRRSMSKSVEYP